MTSLVLERDPLAVMVNIANERLTVELDDGRLLSVPLEWYPRLAQATDAERGRWEFWGNGYAIEWPDIDEHISMEGLLAGRRSGECAASFERWMAGRQAQRR
jgi:Protein of unknown function (DUF2442)